MNLPPDEDAVIELLALTHEVDKYGNRLYRNKEGKLHRIHGPAIVHVNGSEYWYKSGILHAIKTAGFPHSYHSINKGTVGFNSVNKTEFISYLLANGFKPCNET